MKPGSPEMEWARAAAVSGVDSTGLFKAWAFEYAPASSQGARAEYLEGVRRAKVVVWLAGATTSDAVQEEIELAIELNKPILAFRLRVTDRDESTSRLLERLGVKWFDAQDKETLRQAVAAALIDEAARAYEESEHVFLGDRVELLRKRSHGRMVSRWLALGVPDSVAEALALDPSVISPPPGARPSATDQLVFLVGPVGSGKSAIAERIHQVDIEQFASNKGAPIPVFVRAAEVRDLQSDVERAAHGLGRLNQVGTRLVIDGLDEAQSDGALRLVEECTSLIRTWPATSVLLTSRPLIGTDLSPQSRVVPVPALSRIDALSLIQRIEEKPSHPAAEYQLEREFGDAILRPLVAVLTGAYLRSAERHSITRVDLMRYVTERILTRSVVGSERAEELLRKLAIQMIDTGGVGIPTKLLTDSRADMAALRSTRLVEERDGVASFTLPVLGQWFAGQSLLRGEPLFELIASDRRRLRRWRDAVVLALDSGPSEYVSRILGRIASEAPAYLPQLLNARSALLDSNPEKHSTPTQEECVRALRTATDALKSGLGPLAPLLIPVSADNRLVPIGVSVSSQHLVVSWKEEPEEGDSDVIPLPNFAGENWPRGWHSVKSAQVSFTPFWQWEWCLEDARSRLKRIVEQRLIVPSALRSEVLWAAALRLTGRGSLDPGPIPIDQIEQSFRIAVPNGQEMQIEGWPLQFQWLWAEVLRMRAHDEQDLKPPWPGPDLGWGGGWVWSPYSPKAVVARSRAVYLAALAGYSELASIWLAPFAELMNFRNNLPATLRGEVEIREDGVGPVMNWFLDPLPEGSENQVSIELMHDSVDSDPLHKIDDILIPAHRRLQKMRPAISDIVSSPYHQQLLRIFGPTPAKEVVYQWLENDLKQIGWL